MGTGKPSGIPLVASANIQSFIWSFKFEPLIEIDGLKIS